MRKYIILFIATLITVVWYSCEKSPTWQPDILAPVVKSLINIEEISGFRDLSFKQLIPTTDLNDTLSGPQPFVPPFQNPKVGPYKFRISEYFKVVKADTLHFEMVFENRYPFDIREGTIIAFRNDDPQETLLFQHKLQKPLKPGEEIRLKRNLTNILVTNDILLYLEEFRTDGTSDPVNLDNVSSKFQFNLLFLKIGYIEMETPQKYELIDTQAFNFDTPNTEYLKKGFITLYFNNNFPFVFESQIYLLDTFHTVIDSIFVDPFLVESAKVTERGVPVESVEMGNKIELSRQKLKNLGNTKYVGVYFKTSTVEQDKWGNPINQIQLRVTDSSFVDFQMVADVSLDINTDL